MHIRELLRTHEIDHVELFFHDCHYYMDDKETAEWNSLSKKLNIPIMFHLSGF